MTTMAPLAMTAAEPPAGITVTTKADTEYNPYMSSGFGGVGRGWVATLTNTTTKATFKLQVNTVVGSDEPPTAGQICEALKGDISLSSCTIEALAERFGYSKDGHGVAEASFVKGVLARRASGARSVGLGEPQEALKKTPARTEAPSAPVVAKRTKTKTNDAPAAVPPPPSPPPPPTATGVASVLDF